MFLRSSMLVFFFKRIEMPPVADCYGGALVSGFKTSETP